MLRALALMSLLALVMEMERRTPLVRGLFPAQRPVAAPPRGKGVTLRAVRTPRRTGKSTTFLSTVFESALKYPGRREGSKYPYFMHTEKQILTTAWMTAQELDARYKLGCKFLLSSLTVRVPGGPEINFYGADQPGWGETMRGAKNRIVVIDEAQGFLPDILDDLIFNVLELTLMDLRGLLLVGGTPGLIHAGPFYHLTCPEAPLVEGQRKYAGWDLHSWSTADNLSMTEQYHEQLAQLALRHPGIDIRTIPSVRREYFGEWAIDDEDSVYHFDLVRNGWFGPWPREQHRWEFVCGIDMGWGDATAFTVIAYRDDDPVLYVVESYKRAEMQLDDAVKQVRDYTDEYPNIRFVADPSRRQLLEGIQARADVTVMAAEKQNKEDWIALLNGDLLAKKVAVLDPESSPLADEMTNLKWVRKPSGKRAEAPSLPNDCCDAMLYAFRYAYHYRYRETPEQPRPGTPEYWAAEAARMRASAVQRVRESQVDPRERRRRRLGHGMGTG